MRLTIHDLDQEGTGVGRAEDGRIVFCEGLLPGEIALAHPLPDTRPLRAVAGERLTTSPARQTPPCPFFDRCGGCDIQHLDYEAGLAWKHKRAADCFQRIGGLDPELLEATAVTERAVASPQSFNYRNHVRYSVAPPESPGEAPAVGFLARGSHAIVDQEQIGCLIAPPVADQVRTLFRSWIQERGHELRGPAEGFPHAIQVRNSETTGEVLILLHLGQDDPDPLWTALADQLIRELHPSRLVGFLLKQEWGRGRGRRSKLTVLRGRDYYLEQVGAYRCPVHAEAFFQVNTAQAAQIGRTLLEWSTGLPTAAKVWDIYGGTGTLGLGFAEAGQEVTVVERSRDSAAYGKMQAELNGLSDRYTFVEGDAANEVPRLVQDAGLPDLVITDPPRQGLAPAVIDALLEAQAPQWLYVSCDPATLARDVKRILAGGYELARWQVYDMFPWTGHVECVVLITRNI